MSKKFKSQNQVLSLASAIKARRLERLLTLKEAEQITGVDCSQISRFEAGSFRTASKNLQIICNFLQIQILPDNSFETNIGTRLERLAGRSPKLRVAIEDLLDALESL